MKTVKLGEATTPEDMRIYAIGDIHGYIDLLHDLHQQINEDISANPIANHKIIFLGDYIDRGPDSKECLDYLVKLKNENPDVICLKGNHEDKFEAFLDRPLETAKTYLTYGGVECARSYGVEFSYGHVSDDDILQKHARLKEIVPQSHLNFMATLEKSAIFGDYMFVHAGIRPNVALDKQNEHDFMWIRSDFIPYRGLYEKVIIHGHTPHYPIEILPNRINADTCAYETGALTCVILQNNEYRILSTGS
ncbi:metallophosphoesterase family protein [Lentilitoribacter sp. Alg239-R112]|uniref:metallophosphoesterase family protein n=1 Tax=Lentilitoribacter sp. Alg239-R112 TaxID=2305987 RepID=UPI0013A6A00E|nr:metallophosphoesterase family protein [Lentilitoribacter sp. Alg239-R112]